MSQTIKPIQFRNTVTRIVKLAHIIEDEDFQRALNETHGDKIADNFFEPACGDLDLAELHDRLLILDGRHRLYALRKLGYTEWKCNIRLGMSETDYYRAFDILNGKGKLPLKAIELFRFGYKYKDPMRVAIWDVVVKKYKFHIPLTLDEVVQHNTIKAHRALEIVYTNCGGAYGLHRMCNVLHQCFVADKLTNQLQHGAAGYAFLLGLARTVTSSPKSLSSICARFNVEGATASDVLDEAVGRSRLAKCNNGHQTGSNSVAKHVACTLREILKGEDWRQATKPASQSPAAIEEDEDEI